MIQDRAHEPDISWLTEGGEMGRLIRSKDWSRTPLGPIESWPQSLRTTINLCLASNFPINLIWGPQHTQIINDGYWPICGDKFREVMGANYRESWASAWSVIGEAFEKALSGATSFLENQRMFLDRNGYLEETFFTFSLSPIRDESGQIVGLFHPVTETTAKILAERRSKGLRDLTQRMANAKTTAEVYSQAVEAMADYDLDISFAVFYEFDEKRAEARRTGSVRLREDHPVFLPQVSLKSSHPLAPFDRLAEKQNFSPILELEGAIEPCHPYPESPDIAMMLPLIRPGTENAAGVLILGASPRLPFDDLYQAYFEFVAAAVSTAMANARAYEEEKSRAEELEALDQAKTIFFSNISHEFRTPLTLMLVPVEELLSKSPIQQNPELLQSRLEIIHRNSLRLLKLVNALLDFSRIEAGRMQAQFQATQLGGMTADIVSSFRSAAQSCGIALDYQNLNDIDPVYVDPEMWEKVVLNLISNALKYTMAGSIQVKLEQRVGWAILSVKDSGIGISSADLPKLFERFYRVQDARGRSHEGSGIGLAMVQELVNFHGGTIEVESALNVGSTFTVRIPLGFAHLPQDRIIQGQVQNSYRNAKIYATEAMTLSLEDQDLPRNAAELPPSQKRARILLVDDNHDMRNYIQNILEVAYDVVPAADGLDGFEKAKAQRPDLILSDIMMPRLDGFGLIRKIREDPTLRTIPSILISARAGEEAKVSGLDQGADDYLTKPFSTRELMARVAAHLSMARIRDEAAARERKLVAEIEGARRSNQLKDECLATVSHELRTPLNSILGFSHMLQEEDLDSELFTTAVQAICRNAEHQNCIINDLIDVSEFATGKVRLEFKAVEIMDVIRSSFENLKPVARAKDIVLKVNQIAEIPSLLGDANRLVQVVSNLLSNAIRFSPRGSSIELSVRSDHDELAIVISDQGEGMDEHFLPFAFDPIRQEDGSLTRRHGGLGLGLSIVKQIVEAHGGNVQLSSRGKGQGTSVSVILPVARAESFREKPRKLLSGLRVLAVDDDVDAQLLVTGILKRAGAEVLIAGSASEGLKVLQQSKPDIIVSDIGMAEENGYEFLRQVRALTAVKAHSVPAVALTAWAREEDRQMAFEAGYQDHLTKPITGPILIDRVARLMGRAAFPP